MNMKDRKGSMGAKLAAWIAIPACGVVFVGGVIGAFVMGEAGLYDMTEEACRKKVFRLVADHYAVMALDNMDDLGEEKWTDTYFRYGIIKADEIGNLNLNDKNIYLERNFSENVTSEAVYAQSYDITVNTEFDYSGTLWGGYAIYEDVRDYVRNVPVYGTMYNEDDGIFYYEADGEFFPVKNVRIGIESDNMVNTYEFDYDFDRKMYQNFYTDAKLPEDYITFDMLKDTDLSWENWEYISLDNRQYTNDWKDILAVDSGYMRGREITAEQNYEVEGNIGELEIYRVEDSSSETYWVVTLLPEKVRFGWNNDLFVQANALVTIGYGLRYAIYPILALAFFGGIFCFVWLIRAAGHRKGTDEIVMTWIDRVPFDVYLGFAFAAECVPLILGAGIRERFGSVPGCVGAAFLLCCAGWVALLTVLTFAVRVKCGKWWRNTICYSILRVIGRGLRLAEQNMSLLLKASIIFAIVSFLEIYALFCLSGRIGEGIISWMGLKIAQFLFLFWGLVQMRRLKEGGRRLAEGDMDHRIDTDKMYWEFRQHGENLNSISDGMAKAVDERMKSERFKTELITNVSHDIKTPLTSIINYVDLLEKEELSNETAVEYLEVLERQSGRLKKLIEDLIEASKASTGNLAVHLEKLEAGVSLVQTVGEFEEKTRANNLDLLIGKPDYPVYVMADSRHFWRVIDNLMNNICKYAQPGTRVYINLQETAGRVQLIFRNTSRYPLNISSEELMERFVRGDSSRNTEGSGLGLSIAKSLMELMGGTFSLYVDGDLFKVVLEFDAVTDKNNLPIY